MNSIYFRLVNIIVYLFIIPLFIFTQLIFFCLKFQLLKFSVKCLVFCFNFIINVVYFIGLITFNYILFWLMHDALFIIIVMNLRNLVLTYNFVKFFILILNLFLILFLMMIYVKILSIYSELRWISLFKLVSGLLWKGRVKRN